MTYDTTIAAGRRLIEVEAHARHLASAIVDECERLHGVDIYDAATACDLGWGYDELWNSMLVRAEEVVGVRQEDDPDPDAARWFAALDKVAVGARAEALKEAAEYSGATVGIPA